MTSGRKKDILHEVLTSDNQESIPGIEDLNRFLFQPPDKVRSGTSKNKRKKSKKKKTTHYLSQETFDSLDRTLPELRRIIPAEIRRQISKSRLVDCSMHLLLCEFQQKGKDSLLVRQFFERDSPDDHGS